MRKHISIALLLLSVEHMKDVNIEQISKVEFMYMFCAPVGMAWKIYIHMNV